MPKRFIYLFIVIIFSFAGLLLAARHHLWPLAMVALFYVWAVLVAWRPGIWLWALPAMLPILNFSPWNGWLVVDELDLFLLATVAGAYAAKARQTFQSGEKANLKVSAHCLTLSGSYRGMWLFYSFVLLSLLSCWRGWTQAGGSLQLLQTGWALLQTQGYTEPLNSLRSGKSLLWAALLAPLLNQQLQQPGSRAAALRSLGFGMLAGLCTVVLVVVWERAAFPELFNFSTAYRTTALFWEMHTGGAAMDFYLALTLPFAFWALGQARGPAAWLLAAALVVLACYAVLTTFSRGVYGAVFLPLALLGGYRLALRTRLGNWLRNLQGSRPHLWRRRGVWVLALALVLEVLSVLVGGSYMRQRLDDAGDDLDLRVEHWHRGLSLLGSPSAQPMNWLLGIGLGQLPARYAASAGATGWAGSAQWAQEADGTAFLRLAGPSRDASLGGLFAINQRVGPWALGDYRVLMQVRAAGRTELLFKLCEKHQIYEVNCYYSRFTVFPSAKAHNGPQSWQKIALRLQPDEPFDRPGRLAKPAVLSASVLTQGAVADISVLRLISAQQPNQTQNSDFSQGMAYWMQGAGSYYLPWHIDNLLLELLIERGVLQLLLFAVLLGMSLRGLVQVSSSAPQSAEKTLAPFVVCALVSVLLLGLVSSVLDVPRLALLVFLWLVLALQLAAAVNQPAPAAPHPPV